MRDFRGLKVWEKSHLLTLQIYKTTKSFPSEERYGLTSQIRRSCASIPANIAEGCGTGSDAEMARYLQIAMASASELEYHILLARDLEFITTANYNSIYDEVTQIKRMLTPFIRRLRGSRLKK
ncbi:MAG: four helix bundle protein [Chloroflexi bacterium]|nr:four helix bundle protein [Chloroflexota bacterium]